MRQMIGLQYYMEGLLKNVPHEWISPARGFFERLSHECVRLCRYRYNLICVKFIDNNDGSLSLFNLAIAFCNRKW